MASLDLEEQIRTALHEVALDSRVGVEQALRALTESIPGVAFPQVVAHRDTDGRVVRLDVTYFDEIHDTSVRTVTVDMHEYP